MYTIYNHCTKLNVNKKKNVRDLNIYMWYLNSL